jgi:hypothetical protein
VGCSLLQNLEEKMMRDYNSEAKERVLARLLDVLIKLPSQELGEAVIAGLMLLRDKLPAMRECMREVDSKKTMDALTKANEDAYEKLAFYRSVLKRFEESSPVEVGNIRQSETSKSTQQKEKK